MKQKNIKLLTALLLIFSLLLTGGMFAYWASGVLGDEDDVTDTITIGVGSEETTTIDLTETQRTQGVLVPAGYEETGSV